jgi:hypothetical protein
MTKEIKKFIESHGALICPSCEGEGEVGYFCGHDTITKCSKCAGKGLVASLKKQKQSKKCIICNGRDGGCGGCDSHPKGLIEWESYELI